MDQAQTQLYFLNELLIVQRTYNEMIALGFGSIEQLAMYDEATLKDLKEDLRKPAGMEPHPANPMVLIPRAPFQFTTANMKRVLVVAAAAKYYQTIGRPLTYQALSWNDRMTNFSQYLEGLKIRKENEEVPDLPKMSKNTVIQRWIEAFQTYTETVLGARNIPLYYVLRKNTIPGEMDALLPGFPYGAEGGSVIGELTLRATHDHALYSTDNEKIFYLLDEALRNTQYSATLASFKRRKSGREAWLALLNQHMGRDKWETEFKEQMEYLMTHKWTGKSGFALESFINRHRLAFTHIQRCAEHITITIPSPQQRCTYVIDGIHNSDPQLQAAIARCRTDLSPTGLMGDFEQMAATIIPADPVSGGRQTRKRLSGDIGAMTGESDLGISRGPETGVDIRYYNVKAWQELTEEERKECLECRKLNEQRGLNKDGTPKNGKNGKNKRKNGGNGKDKKGQKKSWKKQMEAQIAAYHAKHHGGPVPDPNDNKKATMADVKSYIASLVAGDGDDLATESHTSTKAQQGLKKILQRGKK